MTRKGLRYKHSARVELARPDAVRSPFVGSVRSSHPRRDTPAGQRLLQRPGMTDKAEKQAVLIFDGVSLEPSAPARGGAHNITFRLDRGRILVLQIPEDHLGPPIADAATGLLKPSAGRVLFLGNDWSSVHPHHAASLRGQVGRVFQGCNWVRNLSIGENTCLRALHHTNRRTVDILDEAKELMKAFGVSSEGHADEVLSMRPAEVAPEDLQRAAWARALVGGPALLVLEQPREHTMPLNADVLISSVVRVSQRGTAVIWIASSEDVWRHDDMKSIEHDHIEVGR